jgi:hypothetical protein
MVTRSAFVGNLDAVQAQLTRFLEPLGTASARGPSTVTQGRACCRPSICRWPAAPTWTIKNLDLRFPPY